MQLYPNKWHKNSGVRKKKERDEKKNRDSKQYGVFLRRSESV
jgi:hypothetical protein